jgi:hypothetical protein
VAVGQEAVEGFEIRKFEVREVHEDSRGLLYAFSIWAAIYAEGLFKRADFGIRAFSLAPPSANMASASSSRSIPFALRPSLSLDNAWDIWNLWFNEMNDNDRKCAASLGQLVKVTNTSNCWGVTIGATKPRPRGSLMLHHQRVKIWFNRRRAINTVGGPRYEVRGQRGPTGSRGPCGHKKLHGLRMTCCDKVVCTRCYVGYLSARKCECGGYEWNLVETKAPRAQTSGTSRETTTFLAALTGMYDQELNVTSLTECVTLPSRESAYRKIVEGPEMAVVRRALENDYRWVEDVRELKERFEFEEREREAERPQRPESPAYSPAVQGDPVPVQGDPAPPRRRARSPLLVQGPPRRVEAVVQGPRLGDLQGADVVRRMLGDLPGADYARPNESDAEIAERVQASIEEDEKVLVERAIEQREEAKRFLHKKLLPVPKWLCAVGTNVFVRTEIDEGWEEATTRPNVKVPESDCKLCFHEAELEGVIECCRQTVCSGCYVDLALTTRNPKCPFCRSSGLPWLSSQLPPLRLPKRELVPLKRPRPSDGPNAANAPNGRARVELTEDEVVGLRALLSSRR